MNYTPKPTEVETSTGRYVDLMDPDPSTIVIEDIAHALSQQCRYNGHISRFQSVAEHAVFVSKRLERKRQPVRVQLQGLHHDDHEAYAGDVVRPLKRMLEPTYTTLTDVLDDAIWEALELPAMSPEDHLAVKTADDHALFVEALHFLPSRGKNWTLKSGLKRIETPDYFKGGISPRKAELAFLKRHTELVTKLHGND